LVTELQKNSTKKYREGGRGKTRQRGMFTFAPFGPVNYKTVVDCVTRNKKTGYGGHIERKQNLFNFDETFKFKRQ